MDAFLAYQVQRECSLLLKQTAFLEHLEERLGSLPAKFVQGILESDIPDDSLWLASVRDALGSQELFEEFKRAFDIHDDGTSDDSSMANDFPMSELFEDGAALIRKKGDDMSDEGSLDRPARRRRVTFDQQDSAVDVMGNLASSSSSLSPVAPISEIPDEAEPLLKERSWSPPRPPTPITKIFPLLPMEPIEKSGTAGSQVSTGGSLPSATGDWLPTVDKSNDSFVGAPSQAQPPSVEVLLAPSPRLESKLVPSPRISGSPRMTSMGNVGSSITAPSSSVMASPVPSRPPTSVALIDRPAEMSSLMSTNKELFDRIDMVLAYDDDEMKKNQWNSLLLASRDRLDDDAWMRAIGQILQDEAALFSQFKDMVGYLGDVDDDVATNPSKTSIQNISPTHFIVDRRGPQDVVALEETYPDEFHHLQSNLSMREYEAVVNALQSSRSDVSDDDWVNNILSLLSDAPQVDGMSAIGAIFKICSVRVSINTGATIVESLIMDDVISDSTTLQGGPPSLQELSSISGTDTIDTSTVTTLSSCHTAREELPVLMPTVEMLYAVRKGLADERVFGKILPRYILTKHNRRASISSLSEAPNTLPESPSKLITQLLDEMLGPNSPAFKRFTHFVEEGGMSEFESSAP